MNNLRLKECEQKRLSMEQVKRDLHQQAAQVEEHSNTIEEDLKVEREWRMSLQETMQQDRERISKLQHENGQLKIIADVSVFSITSFHLQDSFGLTEIRNATRRILHS